MTALPGNLRPGGEHCSDCEEPRIFRRPRLYPGLHATLTVITFGIWVVPWISYTLHAFFWAPWRCSRCGSPRSDGALASSPLARRRVGLLTRIAADAVVVSEDPIKNILTE